MTIKLSIIVPCYNESNNLDRLVDAFGAALRGHPEVELVLVDNGSSDDTPQRLESILSRPENSFARSVRVDVNQGYGYGIMFGLRQAAGEFLAWTHADLQTPPADVLRAFDDISQARDPQQTLVRGIRRGRPLFDQLFTTAMSCVATVALQSSLYDINAQPKLFHRSLLEQMEQAPDDFTLDLYLLHIVNQLKFEIRNVDVRFELRTAGESKGGGTLAGKYKLCKRTLVQIYRLRQALRAAPPAVEHVPGTKYEGENRQAREAA